MRIGDETSGDSKGESVLLAVSAGLVMFVAFKGRMIVSVDEFADLLSWLSAFDALE